MKILKNTNQVVKNNSSTNGRLLNLNSTSSKLQTNNNQKIYKFNLKSDSMSNLTFPNQQQYEMRDYLTANRSTLNTANTTKNNNKAPEQSQKARNINNEILLTTTVEKMRIYQELPHVKNSNVLFETIGKNE